jgi:formylglycine-generating enzyme required for sulfatase activity
MKMKFHHLLMLLALFAGIHSAPAQSNNLNIAAAGNQVILFWSVLDTNYVLLSTTNLDSPNWVQVCNAVPVTAVTVTNLPTTIFFRLVATTAGMAFVCGGQFTMGDTLDGEPDAIPISVTVTGFYMETNLVSYSLWQSVYNWATNNGYGFDTNGMGKASNHPVQYVDWYDAVKWCNARSQLAGLTPVYYTDIELTQVYEGFDDLDAVYANWSANGYRLPTEAEWEKAARGGVSGQRFPWGNSISESQANYYGDTTLGYDFGPNGYNAAFTNGAMPYTSPVGSFAPNGYGLYDMAGNVLEWCWDWYGKPYGQPSTTNPTGPATGDNRVLRGGSWLHRANLATCAYRWSYNPYNWDDYAGFRCVRGF